MLTLGPGSVCDICLEPFGTGCKAASAIVCGHSFCSGCIDKLRSAPPTTNHPDPNYKPCPLCRHTFDTRTYIQLHVDHDDNARSTVHVATGPAVSDKDIYTVQRLLERIINIANEGSSEEESRQCIAETKTFLQRQEDSKQFIELQTCCRMLDYTIKIRASNRQLQAQLQTQKTDLEASVSQVRLEKAEVERKARGEREMALSRQKYLRDHAERTLLQYEIALIHCHKLEGDLRMIREHRRGEHQRDEHIHIVTVSEGSDVEMPPSKLKRRPRSTRHNPEHPADCGGAVPCTGTQPTHQSSASRSHGTSPSSQPVFGPELEPVPTDLPNASLPTTQIASKALDMRSADYHGENQSTIRRYAERDRDDTPHNYEQLALCHDDITPPLCTPSSSSRPHGRRSTFAISGSLRRSQHRGSLPKEEAPNTETTTPLAPSLESPSTQGFRNHMLQGLLQDATPFSVSSSQISVSSSSTQFSAVLRHDSPRSDEKTGLDIGYYTLPQPSPSLVAERRKFHQQENLRKSGNRDTQVEEICVLPLEPVPSRTTHQSCDPARAPIPTYDPSNMLLSSASSAANAKARERAEKVEREKCKEKDKYSIKKVEREERRKVKRAEAGHPEYDNYTSSHPGVNSGSSKGRWPSDCDGATDCSQQGTCSGPSHISSHDPPSQRASSSGSKSGRHTAKYTIDTHGHKHIPVHVLSAIPKA